MVVRSLSVVLVAPVRDMEPVEPPRLPLLPPLLLGVALVLLCSADKDTGELLLKNASQEYSGLYSYVTSNRAVTDECCVQPTVTPPVNIAGIIAGALLGLSVLTCLVFCCSRQLAATSAAIMLASAQCLPQLWEDLPKLDIAESQVKTLKRTPGQNPAVELSTVATPNLNRRGAVPVRIPEQSEAESIV